MYDALSFNIYSSKKNLEKGPSVHDIDINENQLMSKLPCEVNDCNKPYLLFYMPYVRCILIGYLNLIYCYLKPLTSDTLSNCLRGSFGVFKKERGYSKMYFQFLQCETVIFLFVQVSVKIVLTWNDNTIPDVLYPGIMVYVDHLHVHSLPYPINMNYRAVYVYEEFFEKLTNQYYMALYELLSYRKMLSFFIFLKIILHMQFFPGIQNF